MDSQSAVCARVDNASLLVATFSIVDQHEAVPHHVFEMRVVVDKSVGGDKRLGSQGQLAQLDRFQSPYDHHITTF